MKVLVAAYRRADYKWIRDHKLYALPRDGKLGIDFYRSFSHIVLTDGKKTVLSSHAKFKEVISSEKLEESGYKVSGRQDKKYALYELSEETCDNPVLPGADSEIDACLKKLKGPLSIFQFLPPDSVLVNACAETDFIFEIKEKLADEQIQRFNSEKTPGNKFAILKAANSSLSYHSMESPVFKRNLLMLDSSLPEICAYLLLKSHMTGISSVRRLLRLIEKDNPLGYDLSMGHPFYQYKFKKFLSASVSGMIPSKPWNELENGPYGWIVAEKDGSVMYYNLFNRNEFELYLLNAARFERERTSQYGTGRIFSDASGRHFLKLNLQIRLKK